VMPLRIVSEKTMVAKLVKKCTFVTRKFFSPSHAHTSPLLGSVLVESSPYNKIIFPRSFECPLYAHMTYLTSNSGHRGGKPGNNRLRFGMAGFSDKLYINFSSHTLKLTGKKANANM
jgi:hypothetical protein